MNTIETESSEVQHKLKFEIISHRSIRDKIHLKEKNNIVDNADLDPVIITDDLVETPPKMVMRSKIDPLKPVLLEDVFLVK